MEREGLVDREAGGLQGAKDGPGLREEEGLLTQWERGKVGRCRGERGVPAVALILCKRAGWVPSAARRRWLVGGLKRVGKAGKSH